MENFKKENQLLISVAVIGVIVFIGLVIQLTNTGNRNILEANSTNQGITVNGEGFIGVKPDIARITLGVEAEGATALAAQQKNSELMMKIIAGLKNLGLEEKDIQTTDFNLFPDRKYLKELGQDKIVGYRAVNQVTITVRDLARIGAVIDQSVTAGATNVNNISFSVEKPEQWREKAINKAIKDARSKAEAMAKASGSRIKRIASITESTIGVRNYQMDGYAKEQALGAGDVSTPIEPGNVKVNANVQMNFEI